MFNLVPLHRLSQGHRGLVMHVLGCPEHIRRVNEMGIRDGVQVEMVRSGTPCIIRTGMQTLCIRGTDLLNVLVQPGVGA